MFFLKVKLKIFLRKIGLWVREYISPLLKSGMVLRIKNLDGTLLFLEVQGMKVFSSKDKYSILIDGKSSAASALDIDIQEYLSHISLL